MEGLDISLFLLLLFSFESHISRVGWAGLPGSLPAYSSQVSACALNLSTGKQFLQLLPAAAGCIGVPD